MSTKSDSLKEKLTENFSEFSKLSDYSLMNSLKADPQSTKDGKDHKIKLSGMAARVFLHEFDHLEGIVFTQRQ